MSAHESFRQRQQAMTLQGAAHLPLQLAYTDVGQGEPIVLLHGIPTWSFLYHEVIPLLEPHVRVLAPDMLGHGYSDRRDCFDRSLRAQARAVIAFLDQLGLERVTLVGHDTGGGVGLILAIEHPSRIARLVLANAVAYDSWPIGDMVALGDPAMGRRPAAEVVAFVAGGIDAGLHRHERRTDEFRAGIVAPYSDEEGRLSLVRCASALNTNHTMELVARHGQIAAPTLMLWGVHDPWQPISDAERLRSEIRGSQLVRLERASHWSQQDTPDEFAERLLAFVKSTALES